MTYQCQTCGCITPDSKCLCFEHSPDWGASFNALINLQKAMNGDATVEQEMVALKADNAALRKALVLCRDIVANAKYSESYMSVLSIIEQTLSKGKTE